MSTQPASQRPTTGKEALLKPHLLSTIERLKKLIEMDAPAVIIGHDAFAVFATALAVYGDSAGNGLISLLRESNLHGRGVCDHEDCTNYVERPPSGTCNPCLTKMGVNCLTAEDWKEVAAIHSPAKRKLIVWQVNERGFVVIDPVARMEISEIFETREEAEAEMDRDFEDEE
jgi:hypothetical protein